MSIYNENLRNYTLDVINKFDVPARCSELSAILSRCSIRDLQDVFPTIVHSIFGIAPNGPIGIGWGLRTTVQQNFVNNAFEALNEFLHPSGPMLAMVYRLLNDSIKFEFDFSLLPHKVAESIRSGHCAQFYSDLVNVDPIRRQITSLSLNAFDFYMLHFIIHGTLPLHKMHPAALYVHNECTKTAYFFICADYLCNFLPSSPDGVVLPANICASVKAPQPMPTLQPLQPQRSPKYLKIPNLNIYGNNSSLSTSPAASSTNTTSVESPRAYAWRTESVLNFFVDIWLRYGIEEVRDLPGSEFVRVVRLFIKQVHTFANAAPFDHTAMSMLRKQAQPMMRVRIYSFLKGLIYRWPLDGSLIVVLELWLSYIQPWRYRYELRRNSPNYLESISLNGFEEFISENLAIYTQIFAFVLARFGRLDFGLPGNASMLYRVVKVFSQKNLAARLVQAESAYLNNNMRSFDSPQRRLGRSNNQMPIYESSWEHSKLYHDEAYMPMFGPVMQTELEHFLRSVQITKKYVEQELRAIRESVAEKQNSLGYLKRFINFFLEERTPVNEKLQKMQEVPELLNISMRGLSFIFNIDLELILIEDFDGGEVSGNFHGRSPISETSSGYLDVSTLSPIKTRSDVSRIKASIDPALYPIQSYECAFLVRFLHQVSAKINEMFTDEMQIYWHRSDFVGRLTRQLLSAPMTSQWFDKPRGVNELCKEQLPARLILRPLGTYKFLLALVAFLLLGYLLWGAASYGIIFGLSLFVFYISIRALIV